MGSLVDIEQALKAEVSLLVSADLSEIDPEVPLHDLGIDSLGLVGIFVFIEKTFGFKLMSSGMRKDDLRTIRSLAERIFQEIG